MLAILQNIWKFIQAVFTFFINMLTFEWRLLDLASGVPALMSDFLIWLPASCVSVVVGIIALQIIIKVFTKGQG